MKFKSLIIAAFVAVGTLGAQAQGIDFMPQGSLLKDAVAKAKAEGKMVFLDCYTSWCGPCKMMSTKIFPTQEVGDFMNPKFVSIKIDMEQGEGPSLVEKLQVSAYPTFIIFNGDGNEVGRFLGGSDAAGFMERVTKNSVDNGSAAMDARFKDGERDPGFLMDYLNTLSGAYKRNQCNEVASIILADYAETFASDTTLVRIFMQHISDPFCPAFIHTAKHPEALKAAIGDKPVEMKLMSVWDRYPRTLIDEKDGQVTLDTASLDRLYSLMKECGEPRADHYRLMALINYAQRKADWDAYVGSMEQYVANPSIDMDDLTMCKLSKPVMEKCSDKPVLDRLKSILSTRLSDLKSGKRPAQTSAGQMRMSRPVTDIIEVLVRELNGEKPARG